MNKQIQSKQHHRHQSIRKLERRNAIKNIDYDAATSSSPSSIMVIPSFRVEGIEGDFDLICRSLGLSGPEDFAIPAAAWEARKSPQGFNNNNNRNSKSCGLSSSFEAKVNEKGNSKSCELVNNPDSEDFRAKVGDRENKRNEKGVDGQISRSFLLVNSTKLKDFRDKVSDRENKGNEKRVNGRNSRSCVLVNDRKKDSLRDGLLNTVVAKLRFSESERSEKRPDSADLGFCEWPSNRNPEKVGVTENERNEVRTNQNLRLCESVDDRDHEKPRVKGSNVDDLLNTIENKGNRNVFTQAQIGVRVRECDEVKCQLSNNQNSLKSGVSSSNGDDVLNSFENRVKVGNEGNENEMETVVGDKNLHEVKCELGSYQNLENSRIIDSNKKKSLRPFESNVRVRESKRIEYDFVPANIDFGAKRTGESRNGNKELSIDSGRGKNRISVRSFRGGIKGARPPLLAPPTVIPPSQQTDNTSSDDFINVDENWFTKAEIEVRVKDCDKVECELANSQNPDNSWVTSSNNNDLLDTLEDKVRGENKGNENVFTRAEIEVRVGDCNEILDSDRAISSETFEPNIRVRERNSIENEFAPTKIEIMVRRTDESFSMRSFRGGIKGARPPLLAPPPVISPSQQTDNMGSSWDLLRSFGPPDDEDSNSYIGNSIQENEMTVEPIEGVGKQRRDVYGEWLGDIRVVSESCSDTSEDRDDYFTNVKMEPLHFVSPLGKFKCTINSWQKGDFLGSGSFGTVYEGFTDDGIFFAVKEVSLLDQGDQGKQSIYQLEQEIFFLSQFEHENIVQYLGTDKDNGKLYIFLELVTKGSLASLYQKYNLQDSQVSAYTRQILNGLNYLHLRKVVHRDIKCANILVDASGSVKLADFGLAKATNLNDVKSCKGTAFWMAPEVVNRKNHGYGLAADIWSLGCTVLEMLTRRIPYSHLEGMQALFRIGKGEPPLVPNSLSREARDFISKCLRVNPDDRPTAAQLLNHPFVKRPLTLSAPTSPFQHGRRS